MDGQFLCQRHSGAFRHPQSDRVHEIIALIAAASGGLLDYSNLAQLSNLSRHTVKAHVEAMSIAHAIYLLSPFHGGGRREITHRPKCYCFDTGFVTFVRGWDSIREDDRGLLWEHLALDALRTITDDQSLYYWRDKSGREIDFVIKSSRQQVDAVECKINPDDFKPSNLTVFRSLYPEGRNFVLSPNIRTPYRLRYSGLQVNFISIRGLYQVK